MKTNEETGNAPVQNANHTPGPWQVGFNDQQFAIFAPNGNDRCGLVVADCQTGWTMTHECEANARLIAAAPELREALADLFDKCAAIVDGFSDESSPHNYTSILNDNLLCIKQSMSDAEIALAKAVQAC